MARPRGRGCDLLRDVERRGGDDDGEHEVRPRDEGVDVADVEEAARAREVPCAGAALAEGDEHGGAAGAGLNALRTFWGG